MRLVALTFSSYAPAFCGVKAAVHSRNEYFPRSLPSCVSRQLLPASSENNTSAMPYPPSKAMPRNDRLRPAFTLFPSARLVMKDRTLKRAMGLVFLGVAPGSTQAQELS